MLEVNGEFAATTLIKKMGPDNFEAVKDLAYCLYDIASNKRKDLPADVGTRVQEAINLSYSITSMAAIPSTVLIRAVKNDDFGAINDRLQVTTRVLDKRSIDSSRPLKRIIEWANDHKLPEFRPHDATFYRESGVPHNLLKRVGRASGYPPTQQYMLPPRDR